MNPRHPRTHVQVLARMRSGAVWDDITIKNVSRSGLMAETDRPPKPCSYVEIRRGTQVIVGRVIWSRGRRFGLRVQDEIDIKAIVSEPRLASRPNQAATATSEPGESRLEFNRRHTERNELRADRSRQWSSAMQFLLVVALGVIAAGFIASEVYHLLTVPLEAVLKRL
jgi:hypothetical protein